MWNISITKSLTIKSGKHNNEQASLTGVSFTIKGSENIIVEFENIVFDGDKNPNTITKEDWDSEYQKIKYAIEFKGNVDACFTNCDFTEYMNFYGGIITADYSNEYKLSTLKVSLTNCKLTKNSAYYAGGALYLEGYNENISLTATNCIFSENTSAVYVHDYGGVGSIGGGAIYTYDAKVVLNNCTITNNKTNKTYETIPTSCIGGEFGNEIEYNCDMSKGGGIYCN